MVFAETIKKLMQKGASRQVVGSFMAAIESSEKIQVAIAEKTIAAEAANISLRHNVPLIDSFVAATCRLHECDVLLSADTDYQALVKQKYIRVKSWPLI